jgi:hypothetical protein
VPADIGKGDIYRDHSTKAALGKRRSVRRLADDAEFQRADNTLCVARDLDGDG